MWLWAGAGCDLGLVGSTYHGRGEAAGRVALQHVVSVDEQIVLESLRRLGLHHLPLLPPTRDLQREETDQRWAGSGCDLGRRGGRARSGVETASSSTASTQTRLPEEGNTKHAPFYRSLQHVTFLSLSARGHMTHLSADLQVELEGVIRPLRLGGGHPRDVTARVASGPQFALARVHAHVVRVRAAAAAAVVAAAAARRVVVAVAAVAVAVFAGVAGVAASFV